MSICQSMLSFEGSFETMDLRVEPIHIYGSIKFWYKKFCPTWNIIVQWGYSWEYWVEVVSVVAVMRLSSRNMCEHCVIFLLSLLYFGTIYTLPISLLGDSLNSSLTHFILFYWRLGQFWSLSPQFCISYIIIQMSVQQYRLLIVAYNLPFEFLHCWHCASINWYQKLNIRYSKELHHSNLLWDFLLTWNISSSFLSRGIWLKDPWFFPLTRGSLFFIVKTSRFQHLLSPMATHKNSKELGDFQDFNLAQVLGKQM